MIKKWLAQFWDDVRTSADSGLLGVARFVGLLYGPIDRNLRIDEAWRRALRYRLAEHVGWRHALGGITYLLLIVLVVTGVLLAFYYRPSVEEAYPSVQHIVSEVSFGWLVRDLHVWCANLIVIVALAHMARVFFEASYKPPREMNWIVGLALLGVVLAFGATGYLLPWDQWAYWTVTEVLDAVAMVPLLGGLIAGAIRGDPIASGATLSRFFALHVIVLPWITLALLSYHFTLIRRRGLAPPMSADAGGRKWRLSGMWTEEDQEKGRPFFPNHFLRSLTVAVLTLAIAITLAILFPRPVGDPANPYVLPDELVSTWVPVDVSLALIRLTGLWGFAAFSILGLSLVLLPIFDRRPERGLRQRPVAVALGLIFYVGFVAAWIAGQQIRSVPPTARPQPEVIGEGAEPGSELPLPEPGPTPLVPNSEEPGREP
ncbi:MAG: cytochrome b N-terminal domain-containing protein [Gemmatimonadota bacterium]|nr:MAG: cytochrome b N-terminal domain-containing protein [Gemmatimonadota bacterium]